MRPLSSISLIAATVALLGPPNSLAFRSPAKLSSRGTFGATRNIQSTSTVFARKVLVLERDAVAPASYDPTNLASQENGFLSPRSKPCRPQAPLVAAGATVFQLLVGADSARAADSMISKGSMDPSTFQPICPASDNLYRVLQKFIEAIVGKEKFVEYGPLIAGGLLRVRLELCVVESFFNEAVGPFIKENGLNWVLPLHETVETFLAGSIFALATTFILVGSTKLLSVLMTYVDILLGWPSRTFGGFIYDRSLGRPVTLDIGFGPLKTRVVGPSDEVLAKKKEEETELVDLSSPLLVIVVLLSGTVNVFGRVAGFLREFIEALDLFVGRYLTLSATFYILVKFLHYKVFPDFP